mgnify:CR=1 FL=1
MAWTEQQNEAIIRRDCGLIVSAAAGSGKTSVLVERLLRILMDDNPKHCVPADQMIVVTFTKDAAAEMRSRLYQALDEQLQQQPENQWLYQQQIRLQNAHISTISSFCFELIRDNVAEQGITAGFRVLNETENRLIASKAADRVLNHWHAEHPEKMQFLWDCFCEKDDKPLETLVMELHTFLGSVPFRDVWSEKVMEGLRQPLERSEYHHLFLKQLEQQVQTAVRLANEAADLAACAYDSVADNNLLPRVELDAQCLEKVLHLLQAQVQHLFQTLCFKHRKVMRRRFRRSFRKSAKTAVSFREKISTLQIWKHLNVSSSCGSSMRRSKKRYFKFWN